MNLDKLEACFGRKDAVGLDFPVKFLNFELIASHDIFEKFVFKKSVTKYLAFS